MYQEGGSLDKSSSSIAVEELVRIVQQRIESGEPPEQVLLSFLQEGVAQEQLGIAFENLGYDPAAFTDLMMGAEQMVQAQQQQQQPQQSMIPENPIPQGFEAPEGEQPIMQRGGSTPLYLPPIPRKGNIANAAYWLNDAIGTGMDTVNNWDTDKAKYKEKQLSNRSYEVDFKGNDLKNYVPTWENLASGKIDTKKEFEDKVKQYSRLSFDPGTNEYANDLMWSENQVKTRSKDQLKGTTSLKDFMSNVSGYSQEDKDILRSATQAPKDTILGYDDNGYLVSKDASSLTPSQREEETNIYKDIQLGKRKINNPETPSQSNKPIFEIPERNMLQTPSSNYDFRYGGDLPKAQVGVPHLFNQNQTKKPTFQEWVLEDPVTRGTASSKDEYNKLYPETFDFSGPTDNSLSMSDPEVTRKRTLGNAYNQVETFIKDNPGMKAFGDISNGLVMGANLANEFFQQNKFDDYKNDFRNSTIADKTYSTNTPPDARGNWDQYGFTNVQKFTPNMSQAMYGSEMYKAGGAFEPHMMYDPRTKESYNANQKEDHLRMAEMGYLHQNEMYQEGGSTKDNAVQEYNDFYNYLKTMRQAVGTQDKAALKEDSFNGKPYTTNTLARDYNKAQQLRKAAGLGLYEDMALTLPQVGQQMRGTVNSWLGTNFQEGGEIEVDNDTLMALIAAGADLEIL